MFELNLSEMDNLMEAANYKMLCSNFVIISAFFFVFVVTTQKPLLFGIKLSINSLISEVTALPNMSQRLPNVYIYNNSR